MACLITLFDNKLSEQFKAKKSYPLALYSFLANPIVPIYSSIFVTFVFIKSIFPNLKALYNSPKLGYFDIVIFSRVNSSLE